MGLPLRCLDRALAPATRRRLQAHLGALLAFQRTLRGFPPRCAAPDGSPFVTIYGRGRLLGCYGSSEGGPGERLDRAFLRALEDTRYGGVGGEDRASLVARVSYPRRPRLVALAEAEARIEVGSDGLAWVGPGGRGAVLLPGVAAELGLGAGPFLGLLARKAGVSPGELAQGEVHAFHTEEIGVAPGPLPPWRGAARRFLKGMVAPDGAVAFGMTGGGALVREGPFLLGRGAVVVMALRAAGARRVAERAAAWLQGALRQALRSRQGEPALAGELALGCLAGLPLKAELAACVGASAGLAAAPWYAAQAALALGREAPACYRAALGDLGRQPWAPWTLLAARALGDQATIARCEAALCEGVRRAPPYLGASMPAGQPEVALSALVAEALRGSLSPGGQGALAAARGFLRAQQRRVGVMSPLLSPRLDGAFPLAPWEQSFFRADVTAHALLALSPLPRATRAAPKTPRAPLALRSRGRVASRARDVRPASDAEPCSTPQGEEYL